MSEEKNTIDKLFRYKQVAIIGAIFWILLKYVIAILITPIAFIFSLNAILGMEIEYNLQTVLASMFFVICFGFHKKILGK